MKRRSIAARALSSFANPALTVGDGVSIVDTAPFAGTQSYSFTRATTSVISTPGSDAWAVGTGDFTVEWFGRQTDTTQFQRIFSVGNFPTIKIGVSIESSTFYYWANDSFRYSSSSSTVADTWYHWAVVRAAGTTSVYRDGTLRGSSIADTNNVTDNTTNLTIGNTLTPATNAAWVGQITNLRWVKGLAVYTGSFTVPTSPLTAVSTANPYGGSNTAAVPDGLTKLLLIP